MPSDAYRVSLRHHAGPVDLDVSFTIDAPWTALFAPSGAGKTTILRMIAGLERPSFGRVVDGPGLVLLDTSRRIFVPPHLRRIRMVAQRPALFPHLSVASNVTYRMGPVETFQPKTLKRGRVKWDDTNDADMRDRFNEIVNVCRIEHLLNKFPSQISGGERQRVALARTIAAEGFRLLLLDEPFTGLEASLRDDIISDLRNFTHKREIAVLLVTHDLGEVFAAEAHVLKMENGRIVASGPAHEVLGAERARLLDRLKAQGSTDRTDKTDKNR